MSRPPRVAPNNGPRHQTLNAPAARDTRSATASTEKRSNTGVSQSRPSRPSARLPSTWPPPLALQFMRRNCGAVRHGKTVHPAPSQAVRDWLSYIDASRAYSRRRRSRNGGISPKLPPLPTDRRSDGASSAGARSTGASAAGARSTGASFVVSVNPALVQA